MKTASLLAMLVFATFNISAATLYVSLESPNPVPPYATWATAATNIQDAVDSSHAGDTVLVTNGVYAVGGREVLVWVPTWDPPHFGNIGLSRVVVTNAIRLESVNGPLVTSIVGGGGFYVSASNKYMSLGRCVYLGSNAVLSGFTLTNGVALQGGGVFAEPSGVVTNCTLNGNFAGYAFFSTPRQGLGGGASGGKLYNCTLTNNFAGGGWRLRARAAGHTTAR